MSADMSEIARMSTLPCLHSSTVNRRGLPGAQKTPFIRHVVYGAI